MLEILAVVDIRFCYIRYLYIPERGWVTKPSLPFHSALIGARVPIRFSCWFGKGTLVSQNAL